MSWEMCDKGMQMVLRPLEEVTTNTDGSNPVEKQEKAILSLLKHYTSMNDGSSLSDKQKSSFSKSEKTLISLVADVQKYVKAETKRREYMNGLAKCNVHLFWLMEWDVRLLKKVVKILVFLEPFCSDVILEELSSSLHMWKKENVDIAAGSKWSLLLVGVESCRRLISRNLMQCLGSDGIQGKLAELLKLQSPTVAEQALAQMLIKVNLQCFQLLENVVDPAWWDCSPVTEPQTQQDHLNDILLTLFDVLKSQVLGNESTLLAGTAVVFFLSLNPNLQSKALSFVDILSWIRNPKTSLKIGNLTLKSDDIPNDSTFAESAFLSGLLACAKEDILFQKCGDDLSIVEWLFRNITRLCYGVQQYPAFLLMSQWYNKVSVHRSSPHCHTLFCSNETPVVKDTMTLVWTHLDSPVDGVNHLVIEIFNVLINCLKYVPEDGKISSTENGNDGSSGDRRRNENPCQDLVKDVLDQTSHMSWHVKGKHRITAAVISMVPIDKFFEMNPDLFLHLFECMGTNYLSPCATDLFKAIIQALILQNPDGKDTDRVFLKYCAFPILRGLTSDNSSIRQNVNLLWLPWTLKALPSAYKLLLDCLIKERSSFDKEGLALPATVSLYKCARNQQLISEVPLDKLYEALSHPDDKLRIDGFSLVCLTNKKSEPLADWELKALAKFLPMNMNMDNAPFRHQIQACLRHVMVRARDSSLASLRTLNPEKGTPQLDDLPPGMLPTLKFVQVIWETCIDSLHLASSFQRLKTSLDWISVILDSFTYQPERHQKKGTTPASAVHLLSFANQFGFLNFCNEESSHILLACIFHGTDEIREMAAELLLQYFPWPLPMATDETTIGSILRTGVGLSLSPKPYESEAGALVIKLVFSKYIKEHHYHVDITPNEATVTKLEGSCEKEASHHFLSQLTSLLEDCLKAARVNVLDAAQSRPAHGFILALRRCLSECNIHLQQSDDWRSLFTKLRTLLVDLLDLCLYVLGGRLHGEATAPSFEQMGMSIQAAVLESLKGKPDMEQPHTDDPVLSTNYQIIATWCWVNIKEISMLFCHLVEKAVDHPSGEVVMEFENVKEIGSLFFRVLTQCRHRGAIEGCNAGFTKYCTKLLFSSSKALMSIPHQILDKVIEQVKGCGSAASITRRSAGLPLIALSIVTAESKTKQNALLKYAVETLIEVIATPVEEQLDENRDIPQVHALNILKAVFRESSVATSNMQHLGTAAVATIRCFSSSHWAVRNGAMQLYETLLQRMLGQKKTRDDRLTTQTVQEFFTHFPNMQEFVVEEMTQAGAQHQHAGLQLHPSLFPIMTILTKLTAGPHELSESLKELKTVVASMKNSPVLSVREMSAQAILPLVPKDEIVQTTRETIQEIPSTPTENCSFNDIHGSLLHVSKFLQYQSKSSSMEDTKEALLERIWLMKSQQNSCALVQLAYVKTLLLLFEKLNLPLDGAISKCLEMEAIQIAHSTRTYKVVQPGMDQYVRFLIDWWLTNGPVSDLPSRVEACAKNNDSDVRESMISFLTQRISMESSMVQWENILDVLTNMICKDDPPCKVLCDALQLMMAILQIPSVHFTSQQTQLLWPTLMKFIKREVNSRSSAFSIGLSAVLVKEYLVNDGNWSELENWTNLLLACSYPQKADVVRKQTATALTIIGSQIVLSSGAWIDEKRKCIFWNLYSSTCNLLMDENVTIREQAARANLFGGTQDFNQLHANIVLENMVRGMINESASFDKIFFLRELLKNIPNLEGAIKDDSNILVDDLFEPEDVNPYQEEYVVRQLELDYLQAGPLQSQNDEVLHQVNNYVTVLQSAFPFIDKQCKDPLNVTCHKATFRSLWQCFHIVHVASLYQPSSQVCDAIKEVSNAYFQLPHLHPVLKRKLKQILKA